MTKPCPECKGEKFVGPWKDDNADGNCSRDYCGTCGGSGTTVPTVEKQLENAMLVVEEVLGQQDLYTECSLCEVVHPEGMDWEHNDGCPLVVGGFVTVDGTRLP